VITAVLLTEALAPHLARPGGRIVSVSSIAVCVVPAPTVRPRRQYTAGHWDSPKN
jgi:NAD(P)-dependent dehydrogenase (short-subunit alcohol dehydrogenase family)